MDQLGAPHQKFAGSYAIHKFAASQKQECLDIINTALPESRLEDNKVIRRVYSFFGTKNFGDSFMSCLVVLAGLWFSLLWVFGKYAVEMFLIFAVLGTVISIYIGKKYNYSDNDTGITMMVSGDLLYVGIRRGYLSLLDVVALSDKLQKLDL